MAKPLLLTKDGKTIGTNANVADLVAYPFTAEVTKTGIAVKAAKPAILWVSERYDADFPFADSTFERVSADRSAGKAAIGAIAGTLIAGPLGLIAGAALGAGKKHVVLARRGESTLLVELSTTEFQSLVGRGLVAAG